MIQLLLQVFLVYIIVPLHPVLKTPQQMTSTIIHYYACLLFLATHPPGLFPDLHREEYRRNKRHPDGEHVFSHSTKIGQLLSFLHRYYNILLSVGSAPVGHRCCCYDGATGKDRGQAWGSGGKDGTVVSNVGMACKID